ncbi:calmodulin-2/4-like [Amphibalanus amphitrite]|uniref:calmodulin-2/4-like n=1 Tax=Amphibalanus amphitrite TaxID=1232801 RepID=UPI001C9284F7|nr:calmodulin-2/4-like [Amphibalanus amphitrite]
MSSHLNTGTRAMPSRQALRYQFDLIDRDHNGSISGHELTEVMRQLGHNVTDAEIVDIMAAVDLDGDGNLTFDEFVTVISKTSRDGERTREEADNAMREAFKVFDKNGRGFIGVSDLRAVLHCLGERLTDEEIEDIIEEVDMDGDGRIDFIEFVRAVTDDGEGETTM